MVGRGHVKYIRKAKRVSKIKRLATAAFAVLAGTVMVLSTAAAPAGASNSAQAHSAVSPRQTYTEFCAQSGNGYCLNDWNGTIGDVKMYNKGVTNNAFTLVSLSMCSGGNEVLGAPSYCPFSDHAIDNNLAGDFIDELESNVNPGWCVGSTTSSSLTILNPCGSSNGNGAGQGTIFVADTGGGPDGCSQILFVNRYWSDRYNTTEYLQSGGAIGVQANSDYSGSSPSCWGEGFVQSVGRPGNHALTR